MNEWGNTKIAENSPPPKSGTLQLWELPKKVSTASSTEKTRWPNPAGFCPATAKLPELCQRVAGWAYSSAHCWRRGGKISRTKTVNWHWLMPTFEVSQCHHMSRSLWQHYSKPPWQWLSFRARLDLKEPRPTVCWSAGTQPLGWTKEHDRNRLVAVGWCIFNEQSPKSRRLQRPFMAHCSHALLRLEAKAAVEVGQRSSENECYPKKDWFFPANIAM